MSAGRAWAICRVQRRNSIVCVTDDIQVAISRSLTASSTQHSALSTVAGVLRNLTLGPRHFSRLSRIRLPLRDEDNLHFILQLNHLYNGLDYSLPALSLTSLDSHLLGRCSLITEHLHRFLGIYSMASPRCSHYSR